MTGNPRQSVARLRDSFPRSLFLTVANILAQSFAKWLIKSALLDLVPKAGIALSDTEASVLATAIVEVI